VSRCRAVQPVPVAGMKIMGFLLTKGILEAFLALYQHQTEEPTGRPDNELALALQAGDESAYDELVRRYQGRVYAVAYRITGNREDALDVAQDSLFKAYKKIDTWKPTGGFLPWLLRLTANQGIDHIRKRKRQQHESLDDAFQPKSEGAAIEPSTMDVDQSVRANEIEERVRAALPMLSPSQRAVFVLRHFEAFPLSDIAAEMGCTVGSVKVHLFRALQKMRPALEDLYDRQQE
jgi:RNA polymerase sigma-70 factor (ECF subfamily)